MNNSIVKNNTNEIIIEKALKIRKFESFLLTVIQRAILMEQYILALDKKLPQ